MTETATTAPKTHGSSGYRIAVVGGDGIGPEVTAVSVDVLRAAGLRFEATQYELGAAAYHRTGEVLPDPVFDELRGHDAILLGAVGDPTVPPGVLERQLLLRLRFGFEQYVNLRPSKLFPGVRSPLADPGEVDFVVVREGTEGPYSGNGGIMRRGTPAEVATEVSLNTAFGIERVVRYAFDLARVRRKHLTMLHKTNVLVHAGNLWSRTVDAVAADYPDVTHTYLHMDAATIFMVTDPSRFDVIVTDNLFGDIITDLAGAVCGGIGLSPSGNINPEKNFPSLFEPVHGSAPDIAGTGTADPTAAVLSAALLCRHLGETSIADAIDAAADADLRSRGGGQARSTTEVGQSIIGRLGAQKPA